MRSTFFGVEIGKTGVNLSQLGLDITGHNVANVETKGFTRQRVVTTAYDPFANIGKLTPKNQALVGGGVRVKIHDQIRSAHLDRRFRTENTINSYWEARTTGLRYVESYFDNVNEETSINHSLASFFEAIKIMAENPVDGSPRTLLQTAGVDLAQQLNMIYGSLIDLQNFHNDAVSTTVATINRIADNIADLNERIFIYEISGLIANDLRDKRNLLLDELSELIEIEYREVPHDEAPNYSILKVWIGAPDPQEAPGNRTEGLLVNHDHRNVLGLRQIENSVAGEATVFQPVWLEESVALFPGTGGPFLQIDYGRLAALLSNPPVNIVLPTDLDPLDAVNVINRHLRNIDRLNSQIESLVSQIQGRVAQYNDLYGPGGQPPLLSLPALPADMVAINLSELELYIDNLRDYIDVISAPPSASEGAINMATNILNLFLELAGTPGTPGTPGALEQRDKWLSDLNDLIGDNPEFAMTYPDGTPWVPGDPTATPPDPFISSRVFVTFAGHELVHRRGFNTVDIGHELTEDVQNGKYDLRVIGGELHANMQMRDVATNAEHRQGIPYYIEMLNDLARALVQEVNKQHQLGWTDPLVGESQTGVNFFHGGVWRIPSFVVENVDLTSGHDLADWLDSDGIPLTRAGEYGDFVLTAAEMQMEDPPASGTFVTITYELDEATGEGVWTDEDGDPVPLADLANYDFVSGSWKSPEYEEISATYDSATDTWLDQNDMEIPHFTGRQGERVNHPALAGYTEIAAGVWRRDSFADQLSFEDGQWVNNNGDVVKDPNLDGYEYYFNAATVTAKNISLSDAVKDSNRNIAAALDYIYSPEGSPPQLRRGDNENMNELYKLFSEKKDIVLSHNDRHIGSFDGFATTIRFDVANTLNFAKRTSETSNILTLAADRHRTSVSGVSLDEEMTNLIRYQHAYSGAARVITAMDEALDRLINGTGRVGL